MDQESSQSVACRSSTGNGRLPLERQILALDALSKLTKQFCDKPDFEQLIDILLMTLCGQFSVADSFALLRKPSSQTLSQSFFATGDLKSNILLGSLQLTPDDWDRFSGRGTVCLTADLRPLGASDNLISILTECGVNLVCPLVHSENFFGIIGLGERVTGKSYGKEDLSLLGTIISTITPLVANSYLFWEIASLNAWYLDILNSVKQGVFVFDRHYKLKKINTAGLDILKTFVLGDRSKGDFINSPIAAVFPESIFGGWARQIVQSRARKQTTASTSVIARAQGTERIYNVSITGTVENAEIGTALIITLDDVTVQKENEQRLFDLQKLADKGLMASSISHELNNFLTLILGGVELMQMALVNGQSEKARDLLDKLGTNIANMQRFTTGLTDYARLDSEKQRADLNEVISDVLAFLSVQTRFKQVAITSDLNVDLPSFRMDVDQIAQLLLNLLTNSVDAIRESGRKDGAVSITTSHDDGNVILVVADNGVGMSSEVRERIFTLQFTTKERGHGYGLVTCAKIVENHSGTVAVESSMGEGATFTISFPVAG